MLNRKNKWFWLLFVFSLTTVGAFAEESADEALKELDDEVAEMAPDTSPSPPAPSQNTAPAVEKTQPPTSSQAQKQPDAAPVESTDSLTETPTGQSNAVSSPVDQQDSLTMGVPAPDLDVSVPDVEIDPAVSPPAQMQMQVETDTGGDIKSLEERFQKEVEKTSSLTMDQNPEESDPLGLFSMIPLRPQMSDDTWKKWAGPALNKLYKVRKNDSLWKISERLFGTPYLWPKVWNLNAMFLNPHVIEPKVEMRFTPGNPNSAPFLALVKKPGEPDEEMPLLKTDKEMTLLEKLDFVLKLQNFGQEPPFKSFLLKDKPKASAVLLDRNDGAGLLYSEGDDFEIKTAKLDNGTYSIVRAVTQELADKNVGNRIQWMGVASVENSRVKIKKGFNEIQPGDYLIPQDFRLSPLAIYEESFDLKEKQPFATFVPLQEGTDAIAASEQLVGLHFPKANEGPRVGALITVNNDGKEVATLLLINRDEKLGTAWIVQSNQEIVTREYQAL